MMKSAEACECSYMLVCVSEKDKCTTAVETFGREYLSVCVVCTVFVYRRVSMYTFKYLHARFEFLINQITKA